MCVLMVDDEALIRMVMAETLIDAGFEVVEADNGEHAVSLIRAARHPFSLLVTDLTMPGTVDGLGVATAMRRQFPHAPVILASGRPDLFEPSWRERLGYSLLSKPYMPRALLAEVGRLLKRPA